MVKARLLKRPLFFQEILFFDSIGRAGKFLLAKIAAHFERVDYFQYQSAVEHIPILWHLGCLSSTDAQAFLQLNVELASYDRVVGRSLNTRASDSSCVGNAPTKERYFKRAVSSDGLAAAQSFLKKGRRPSFVTHELIPHAKLLFDAIPRLKIINIQRHPAEIIYSWHRKEWGRRFGRDPLSYIPVAQDKQGKPVPWWAVSWSADYQKRSVMEREALGVLTLVQMEREGFARLSNSGKKCILFVGYDAVISNPKPEIKKIGAFLKSSPLSSMTSALRKEGCYRAIDIQERRKKYQAIIKEIDASLKYRLEKECRFYEKCWNLKESVC